MKLGIESIVRWARWPVVILMVGVIATAVSLAGPWLDDEFVEAGPAETVIAWFDTPGSGTTLHRYSDLVRIQVSGIGQAKGARYNDAFYFIDSQISPPENGGIHLSFTGDARAEEGDGVSVVSFIRFIDGLGFANGATPPFGPDSSYDFVIDIGPGGKILTLGTGDGGLWDNTGRFEVRVAQVTSAGVTDSDGDGIDDAVDNCPEHPNPDQSDRDMDGIGDACDTSVVFEDEFTEIGPSETIQALFAVPGSGTTADQYTGFVRLQVNGTGQAKGARYNDAFYFVDDQSSPPENGGLYLSFTGDARAVEADGVRVIGFVSFIAGIGFVSGATPPFNPTNEYDFVINIGPEPRTLTLGTGDGGLSDNSGHFELRVTQAERGATVTDSDADGIPDVDDNCPTDSNSDQTDTDLDGNGDACDADDDGDEVPDESDNCPFTPNHDQLDLDGDGLGDPCDADPDGDGIGDEPGEIDNCPLVPNPFQDDTDQDSVGDPCDPDDDNDGICDEDREDLSCVGGPDNCATIPNPGQTDADGDGIGDACDADLDGDGIENDSDNCSNAHNPGQDDTDWDGQGDACDPDDDGDAVPDTEDNCPLIANSDQLDDDGDGRGNPCDDDLDGDGVGNLVDNCPTVPNSSQLDLDGDGLGDACDPDIDADGVPNASDLCAGTPPGQVVDPGNGCSIAQLCPCSGPRGTTLAWKNHGQFVSCTARAAEGFLTSSLIAQAQKDAAVSEAAGGDCGDRK